jgi:hypothetical protein
MEANARAQELRRDGHLSAAREQLLLCADASCPALVRADCAERLDDLDKAQPTIVFVAKTAGGRDVTAVKVTMDGKPLTDKLDGTELRVDPGQHVFTFAVEGQPPTTMTFVLAAGEKARRERIVVGGGTEATPAVTPPSPALPSVASRSAHLVVVVDAGATVSVDGNITGQGRFEGPEASGPHHVSVTEQDKRPYDLDVDLREGETRTLDVTLEAEHRAAIWPWVVGGVAIAAGVAVGGYFLFKSSPGAPAAPPDQLGSLQLMAW